MHYTEIIDRLASEGADSWAVYRRARQMVADGADIVELAIGEPDVPTPESITDAAIDALRHGRTDYAASAGEPSLRNALAHRYSTRLGRSISPDQVICFPGTQTALYTVLRGVAGPGDEVVVGDPMYATYEPVVVSAGASVVRVPLDAAHGFRIQAEAIARAVTPRTTAILLNTPHNPTGAVLTADDVDAIGRVAQEHDLWLIVDEVYEDLIHGETSFVSPLSRENLAERVVVLNSISKSHAAPGFRSGWCVGPEAFCRRLLPLCEAVLFGNQPFIADATEAAVSAPSSVAAGMAQRFAARAARLADRFDAETTLRAHRPGAGMFVLVDVSSTGRSGLELANELVDHAGVAVMPGSSFGQSLDQWIRVALTQPDDDFDEGCRRIIDHVNRTTMEVPQ
jgi:arginine:pyruvate transaminase